MPGKYIKYDHSKHFKSNIESVSGHVKGLITDGELFPKDSFQDGTYNLDIYKDGENARDRRRAPYDLLQDLASVIPSGYAIADFCQKRFVDGLGVYQDCLVAVATKASNPTKIYIKGYYSPDETGITNGWQNAYKSSGWNTDWVEVTERYMGSPYTFAGTTKSIESVLAAGGGQVQIKITGHGFADLDWVNIQGVLGDAALLATGVNGIHQIKYIDADNFYLNTTTFGGTYTGGGICDWCKRWIFGGGGGLVYNLKLSNPGVTAPFNNADNWFKGFFAIGSNGNLIGIVTRSTWQTDPDNSAVKSLFFFVDKANWRGVDSGSGICRFPVSQFNLSSWNNITSVRIMEDFPNQVRFFCGKDSRDLWLGFINKRRYFGSFNIGSAGYNTSDTGWCDTYGVYTGDIPISIKVKLISAVNVIATIWQLQFAWSIDAGVTYTNLPLVTINGTSVNSFFGIYQGITVNLNGIYGGGPGLGHINVGDVATFSVTASGDEIGWHGFWFGYDIPMILNKMTYITGHVTPIPVGATVNIGSNDIGWELGIRYSLISQQTSTASGPDALRKVYSLVIEMDGYQALFIKSAFQGTAYLKINYFDINIFFEQWFDRRISASLLFYYTADESFKESTLKENSLFETFLLDQTIPGIQLTSKMGDVKEDNAYKVALISGQFDSLIGTVGFSLTAHADGLSCDSYLNNYRWQDIFAKGKYATKVGENIIVANLSSDTVNRDEEGGNFQTKSKTSGLSIVRNGKEYILISQVQADGKNANSVFPTERLWQTTRGEEILGIQSTIGLEFLVFTANECRAMALANEATMEFQEERKFRWRGLIGDRAITRATIGDEFAGVYWLNKDTIWRYIDKYPEDILYGKWRKKFEETITDANKSAAIAGFMPRMKDVYFLIGNTLYLWNILLENWRPYVFPDVPTIIKNSTTGEVYFLSGSKIYTTVDPYTVLSTKMTMDKGTVSIPFVLLKTRSHGELLQQAVVDGVEIAYEMDTLIDGGTGDPTVAELLIQCGGDGAVSDIYPISPLTGKFNAEPLNHWNVAFTFRSRPETYDIKISSVAANEGNIQNFELFEIIHKAKLTGKPLTR